jgi:putative GTP pyrophosphokinase
MSLELEDFLKNNRITTETWEKANIEWKQLLAIFSDHTKQQNNLQNSAVFFANVIQTFPGVHSVRWRVKDAEHLIEKIIRKKAESNPKYEQITSDNYANIVTDLVGVRALHLFKEDAFSIHSEILDVYDSIECPVAYIREGDSEEIKKRCSDNGLEVKNHPAGYRSIHYVIRSRPLKRDVIAEIQVRTIFEEGWSEIDHKVRYPNFSDNPLVGYFLEIFNRMAGSADDMGGFVLGLVSTLTQLQKEISQVSREKEKIYQDMEEAITQLEKIKKQDAASQESIAKLKSEVSKLKSSQSPDGLLGNMNSLKALSNYGLDDYLNHQKFMHMYANEYLKIFGKKNDH